MRRAARIELAISALLRWGVIASLTLLVLGTIARFAAADRPTELARLIDGSDASGTTSLGDRVAILGLALLVATPVLRVLVSIAAFAAARDGAFVAITLVVLVLLAVSCLLGLAT